jgi:hypothetical protein
MPVDEQATDSSTVLDQAQDQALAERDFEAYKATEDARERAARSGKAIDEAPPPSKKASDTAAESDTAKKDIQERKPRSGEDRKAELAAEIKELLKQRAELRGEVEKQPGDKKADPPPADVPIKQAESKKAVAPEEPKLEDFATFAEFRKAETEYFRQVARFETRQAMAEAREAERVAEANRVIETDVQKSISAGRKKYPDFDEVALSSTTPISKAMDGFILDSEYRDDVLYRLGENDSAEARRIAALAPFRQVRALLAIEQEFSEQARPEKTIPVKRHTEAPPPAAELGGRTSEPSDAVLAALNRGDFAAYQRLANARDAKAKSG